jgi:hypothetical protein
MVQRVSTRSHRGYRGNFAHGQLGDERVFFEYLRVAPAPWPIEFRDHGGAVLAVHEVDAILVAVERQQASVAADAATFERVEDPVRRERGIGRGGGHPTHCTGRKLTEGGARKFGAPRATKAKVLPIGLAFRALSRRG